MSLIAELKRRKVFKVGAAYLVVAWLAVQVASIAFPAFDAPPWALRIFMLVALLGFPLAVVLSWLFESTPDGVRFETPAKGSKRVMAAAVVLIGLALGWYFLTGRQSPRGAPTGSATSPAVAGVPDKSIAVLPFVDLSQAHDQEFFSDGIAEELLNRLAQMPDLMVAARTSAFQFKGRNIDIGEIGRKLNVAHVLEGSVRKDGSHLRITAQLIRATTGFHVWSQTFDRDAVDIFKVQDEIAVAIAQALESRLGGQAPPSAQRPVDPAAYDDYLQARSLLARRIGDNLKLALAAFDRAIARDPAYSPAYSGRAFALMLTPGYTGSMPLSAACNEALASVEQALRLDPQNAEAFTVRATVRSIRLEVVAARADLDRAIALAPGSVDVLNFFGDFLMNTGNLRAAERMKRQAMALDPLTFIHPMNLSDILRAQGRYADALAMSERALQLGGGRVVRNGLTLTQLRLGAFDKARENVQAICQIEDASCLLNRVMLLAATGDRGELDRAEAALDASRPAWLAGAVFASDIATVYANEVIDPSRATAALLDSLHGEDYQVTEPLLFGPQGARLPEEVSSDAGWLAAWNDARLADLMVMYRANIAAFRRGE